MAYQEILIVQCIREMYGKQNGGRRNLHLKIGLRDTVNKMADVAYSIVQRTHELGVKQNGGRRNLDLKIGHP